MTKYVSRPRAAWFWDGEEQDGITVDSITVFEGDRNPVEIGLLDADGDPIYRLPDTVPFGFCR